MKRRPTDLLFRILCMIPVIGWIVKDISKDPENVFYAIPILLTALILGFQIWGPVVFTMAALCFIPFMFGFLIYISWPFRRE